VQKYDEPDDVKLFATAQFSRYREVESFLHAHFVGKKEVEAKAVIPKPAEPKATEGES
jgi:hypothetical protein